MKYGVSGVDFGLSLLPEATSEIPLSRRVHVKLPPCVSGIGHRKYCDPDPPFLANQGTCLCYGLCYPYLIASRPVFPAAPGHRLRVYSANVLAVHLVVRKCLGKRLDGALGRPQLYRDNGLTAVAPQTLGTDRYG